MYRGFKTIEGRNKIDNHGDGLYELVGKSKKFAKKTMHGFVRTRAKAKLNNDLKKLEVC